MRCELNTFDSSLIADRVYFLDLNHLIDKSELQAALPAIDPISSQLIIIRSPLPVPYLKLHEMGQLVELKGDFQNVHENLSRFPPRYKIRTLKENDWPDVLNFISSFSSPTRLSRDKKIPLNIVHEHKLKILKTYKESTGEVFLAHDKDKLIGLQCSYLTNDILNFYEITIHDNYRMGFLALDLLRSATNALSCDKKISSISTKIYLNNENSINLFKKIGLKEITPSTYYYHIWLSDF